MIDDLEALVSLQKLGTMTATANHLRITASAVSKRIAALEDRVGYPLIEKEGRLVRITPAGTKLIERVRPLLTELRLSLTDQPETIKADISIGVSESILASWGPKVLQTVGKKIPELRYHLGSHRSPVVIERVLSGEYALGLCAGISSRVPELVVKPLMQEAMILVPSSLKPLRLTANKSVAVITIEPHSATWDSLKPQLKKISAEKGIKFQVTETLQSFTAVVQLAKTGYAHGLAPIGVALAMGVPENKLIKIPGLTRSISLIGRQTTFSRTIIQNFTDTITEGLRD